jgi:hypothetical protein
MSRPLYDVKEKYVGTGALATYSFDFKITAKDQLLVLITDDDDEEVQRLRGTDTTFLSDVDYDAVAGGGDVILQAVLPADYTIIILLADDAPTQPFEFSDKTKFTLSRFEAAMDWLSGQIQRLSYQAKQSLRIHDLDEEEDFDNQLPPGISAKQDRIIVINDDGTGYEFGPSWRDIPTAQGTADSGVAAAAAAQGTANDAIAAAATADAKAVVADGKASAAQTTANTGVANAATAQTTANTALANAATAQAEIDALELLMVTAFVTTQSVAAAGTITVNTGLFQNRKVQGNGAARIANAAPFGTSFVAAQDGMRILLTGKNAVNTLTIPYADSAWGVLVNGDCELGLNDTLELILDFSLQRFYEISRNF